MEQSHEATQWEDVSKPHTEVQSQDSKPESPDTCLLTDSRQSSQTGIIGGKKKGDATQGKSTRHPVSIGKQPLCHSPVMAVLQPAHFLA